MTAEIIAGRIAEGGVPDLATVVDAKSRQALLDIILGFVDGGMLYVKRTGDRSRFIALVVDNEVVGVAHC